MPNYSNKCTSANKSSGPATPGSRNELIAKSFNDRISVENICLKELWPNGRLTPEQQKYLELRFYDLQEDIAGTDPGHILDLAIFTSLTALQAFKKSDELFNQVSDNISNLIELRRYFEDLRVYDIRYHD